MGVETRADPDWASIDTDLVLTTIEPRIAGDGIVRIQPFLTDADVSRVQAAVARVRRAHRLARLRTELGQRGRQRVLQHYTQAQIARATVEVYRQLMADR